MLAENLVHGIPEDIEERFAAQMERIAGWATDKILPTFQGLPGLAHQAPEGEARLNTYLELTRVEQSFLNLLLVQLHHLWEQQLAVLVRDAKREAPFDYRSANTLYNEVFQRFGFDITFFETWQRIDTLRLASNVVKHSAAKDAERLKTIRPEWFTPPKEDFMRVNFEENWPQPELAAAGQDFWPRETDYRDAADGVRQFWKEFGDVRKGIRPKPKTLRNWIVGRRVELLALCEKHGARNVRLFGSVARNEAGPASDIDLLVNFDEGRSLLDHVGLQQDLEDFLDRKVDVVSERGLKAPLRDRILREAIPL